MLGPQDGENRDAINAHDDIMVGDVLSVKGAVEGCMSPLVGIAARSGREIGPNVLSPDAIARAKSSLAEHTPPRKPDNPVPNHINHSFMPLTEDKATPVTSPAQALVVTSKPVVSQEYRLKRMQGIVRAVNEKIAPELRALQLLRSSNAPKLTSHLAKRYY